MLGLFLLRVQQISCLLARHKQRLTNGVGLFQLTIGEQLKFFTVLEPASIGARVAWDAQRIDFVCDERAGLVQGQLIGIDIFSFTLILDINLELKTNLDQLVEFVPG